MPERKKKTKKSSQDDSYCKTAANLLANLLHPTVAGQIPAKPITTNNQYTSNFPNPENYLRNLKRMLGVYHGTEVQEAVTGALDAIKRYYKANEKGELNNKHISINKTI